MICLKRFFRRSACLRGKRNRKHYCVAALSSSSTGVASLAGASQLNAFSAEPWNVHSAAAGSTTFFGLAGLSDSASAPDAPAADAADAEDAADTPRTPDAELGPAATRADEAAADAADAAPTSEAVMTCSIDPSTTTREPSMPAPRWAVFSVSDDFSASLLRINCSHASVFL